MSQKGSKELGDNDGGESPVSDEQGESSNGGHNELVPPLEINHVVDEAQEGHETDREQGRVVLDDCCVPVQDLIFAAHRNLHFRGTGEVEQELLVDCEK